jgi:transcriptional regulator with XRE-family HTH domain
MRRENILARLLRAVSGKSQEQFGEETGIHASRLACFELGRAVPSRRDLERMAAAVGLSLAGAEEGLRALDMLRKPPLPPGAEAGPLAEIAEGVRAEVEQSYRRLLALRQDAGPSL